MMLGCRAMAQEKQTGYYGPVFAFYPCRKVKI